jgi:hypothetical protein
MRFRRREDDWDDDWDDDTPKKPDGPGLISTPRILVGLLLVIIAAVIIGGLVGRHPYEFDTVPEPLLGMWTCDDPVRSDLWVEFKNHLVTFGTGGTGNVTHRVLGVDHEEVGEISRYQIVYRDVAGKQHHRTIMLMAGGVLRFADDAQTDWKYFGE